MATASRTDSGLSGGLASLMSAKPEGEAKRIPELPLSVIRPSRYQPRESFESVEMEALAESIREHGVLQPIVVRKEADHFEIIAGERRFRAAGLAGLTRIPAIVREATNEQALALALIENIQREDLNPIEEARAIKRLIDEFDYTHDRASKAIGRSRSATTNLLRLLALSAPIQQSVVIGELEMGHARALLALGAADQEVVAKDIVLDQLSVRQTEARVSAHLANSVAASATPPSPASVTQVLGGHRLPDLQDRLETSFAAGVSIRTNRKGKGKVTFDFTDEAHFVELIKKLSFRGAGDA